MFYECTCNKNVYRTFVLRVIYIPFFLPSLSFPRHSVDKDLIRKDSSKILFGYNNACIFIKFGNLINACYVIYPFINHLVKYLKVHGVTDLDLRILASPREYTFLTFLNDSKIGRYPVQRQRFPVQKMTAILHVHHEFV